MTISKVDVIDLLIILSTKYRASIWIINSRTIPELPINVEILSGECENEESEGHTCNR